MKTIPKGVIMKIEDNKAHVFTTDCRMLTTDASEDMFVGKEIGETMPETVEQRPRKNRTYMLRAVAATAAVLLLVAGLVSYRSIAGWLKPTEAVALVSIDINPAVQLRLDEDYIVHDVFPINEDARQLAQSVELKNLPVKQAIHLWVAAAQTRGMTGDGNVLLSGIASSTQNVESILGSIQVEGFKITVLYEQVKDVDKNEILQDATTNGMSIGRQILLRELTMSGISLTVSDVEGIPLASLLAFRVTVTPTPTPMPTPTPTPTPTETTAATTAEPTPTPTPTPVPTTVATTTKATTAATTTATTVSYLQKLQVVDNGNGLAMSWGQVPGDKEFNYYKVVISKNDSAPMYPGDGYLYAISNTSQTTCSVDNSKKYGGGDFGGYLTPGEKYYFAVTYVFKDGTKLSSNVVRTVYNGPAYVPPAPPDMTGVELTQTSANTLAWTRTPTTDGFKYYKVVFSVTDSAPQYPEDGYLYALGADSNTCSFEADQSYNGGDVGGKLVSGQTYHVSITYVFESGYYPSNTIPVTVP